MSVPEPSRDRFGAKHTNRLVLVFDGADDLSLVDVGALLRDIETLYWLCADTREDVNPSEFRMRVAHLHLGSPLELVLELPSVVWHLGFGFTFAGALAMIFKLPARYQQERWHFWQTRLAADKAKRDWVEWREAEYLQSPIILKELTLPEDADEVLDLPPED